MKTRFTLSVLISTILMVSTVHAEKSYDAYVRETEPATIFNEQTQKKYQVPGGKWELAVDAGRGSSAVSAKEISDLLKDDEAKKILNTLGITESRKNASYSIVVDPKNKPLKTTRADLETLARKLKAINARNADAVPHAASTHDNLPSQQYREKR